MPSGDPGSSGSLTLETYPSPREGASILSYQMGLVGSSRNSSADTIVSCSVIHSHLALMHTHIHTGFRWPRCSREISL